MPSLKLMVQGWAAKVRCGPLTLAPATPAFPGPSLRYQPENMFVQPPPKCSDGAGP